MRDGGDLQPASRERAVGVYRYAGLSTTSSSSTRQAALDDAIRPARPAVAEDPFAHLPLAEQIDVVVDVTGSVEFGAQVVLEAFAHGKHVVLMNAEVDATIGPILQVYAHAARRHPLGVRRRRAGRCR